MTDQQKGRMGGVGIGGKGREVELAIVCVHSERK